jgi:hypothetical protein
VPGSLREIHWRPRERVEYNVDNRGQRHSWRLAGMRHLVSPVSHHSRPTIGVLAGWQIYWTARPLSYLNPIFRGIRQAAADLDCNLLLGCGLGPTATSSDPLRPAWPFLSPETDFVPIGPWNTDGLIAINPLHSDARSRDLRQVRAAGHPVQFIGSGEDGPTLVADNSGGILAALGHLVEHGHQRIAFIAGSQADLAGDTGARLTAYRAALEQHGLADDMTSGGLRPAQLRYRLRGDAADRRFRRGVHRGPGEQR